MADWRPPFRADHVGSLLRPPALKALRLEQEAGKASTDDLRGAEDAAIRDGVKLQDFLEVLLDNARLDEVARRMEESANVLFQFMRAARNIGELRRGRHLKTLLGSPFSWVVARRAAIVYSRLACSPFRLHTLGT